jgi:hypothetical protein
MVDEADRDDEGQEEELEEVATPVQRVAKKSPPRKHGANSPGVGSANMNGRTRTLADGTPNSKWQDREAELMWPEILQWVESTGHSAYEVSIQVVRLTPAGPEGALPMGSFDGNAAIGDKQVGPGDRLMQIITDQFHMATARGPARYEVRFVWKMGSGRIGTGILNLPSPAEIIALRNAAYSAASAEQPQQQGGVGARPPGPPMHQAPYSSPPPYGQPQQPPWAPYYGAPMYPHYGMGYPQTPQGLSPEMAALQSQLERTQGALNEALAAAREGRQPRIEGVAAPPVSEAALVEKVTAGVLMALHKAGVIAPQAASQPATVAAPPVAGVAADQGLRGEMDDMMRGVFRTAVQMFKSNVEKSVKQMMGVGGVPEDTAAEIAEPEPAKDEFKTPFDVASVSDVKWPDGSPVRYAADRSSGDISPMGLAFSNPYMVEKGMNIAQGVTEALTDALKGLAKQGLTSGVGRPQQPTQVVREIPKTASDATVEESPTPPNNTQI